MCDAQEQKKGKHATLWTNSSLGCGGGRGRGRGRSRRQRLSKWSEHPTRRSVSLHSCGVLDHTNSSDVHPGVPPIRSTVRQHTERASASKRSCFGFRGWQRHHYGRKRICSGLERRRDGLRDGPFGVAQRAVFADRTVITKRPLAIRRVIAYWRSLVA
jgi:hypothetical protein